MSLVRSVLSLEYVTVDVTASEDPTGDVVKMAFLPDGDDPATSDWEDAEWDPAVTTSPYKAQCLVGGPDTVGADAELEVGRYIIWLNVVDNPEILVRPYDMLEMIGEVVPA